ncbi:MAG: 23S rRNA (guanosine2251-2'-O)-methyltransferase [Moritella sp.]|jgi:23S rRNA (guanosine2251-2'-O)-methyltransferase
MSSELIFGMHAVNSLLEHEPERFIEVFVLKGREDERLASLVEKLNNIGIAIQLVNRKTLDNKCDGGRHNGVLARVIEGKKLNESDLDTLLDRIAEKDEQPLLLILDGITDPHNLGACLRSADAAGVHAVIVPKDKSVQLTSVVRKVACGAAETVPLIAVTNLARTMRELQDRRVWIVGTAGEATQDLYQPKLTGPLAIAMGSEDKGLRRLTREHCDELISIPMAGSVSSLNVSVATGICLFEVVRQRQAK